MMTMTTNSSISVKPADRAVCVLDTRTGLTSLIKYGSVSDEVLLIQIPVADISGFAFTAGLVVST
jgi:hypothetical protein